MSKNAANHNVGGHHRLATKKNVTSINSLKANIQNTKLTTGERRNSMIDLEAKDHKANCYEELQMRRRASRGNRGKQNKNESNSKIKDEPVPKLIPLELDIIIPEARSEKEHSEKSAKSNRAHSMTDLKFNEQPTMVKGDTPKITCNTNMAMT